MMTTPGPRSLYRPEYEHDSCGVAFVVDMYGRQSRDIVEKAITALVNLEHRGAIGSDAGTGDGAGILTQMPDAFLRAVVDFDLPAKGEYAVGIAFLPQDADGQWAVGEKFDARVTQFDRKARRVQLSIKALEMAEEKEAMAQFGSADSGASLGDILGAAFNKKRGDDE